MKIIKLYEFMSNGLHAQNVFFIILGSIVNVVLEVGGRARGGGGRSLYVIIL